MTLPSFCSPIFQNKLHIASIGWRLLALRLILWLVLNALSPQTLAHGSQLHHNGDQRTATTDDTTRGGAASILRRMAPDRRPYLRVCVDNAGV